MLEFSSPENRILAHLTDTLFTRESEKKNAKFLSVEVAAAAVATTSTERVKMMYELRKVPGHYNVVRP